MAFDRSLLTFVLILGAGVGAIVLASVALIKVHNLSLPFPAAIPALNICAPILIALALPLCWKLKTTVKKHAIRLLLPYLASASSLAPFALLILSLVYGVPSNVQRCAADQQWLRLFEHKDTSIRTIQTRLQCCGLNSMHDRAWPFPAHNVDARTCERTQGYTIACGDVWRREEATAAALTAAASFLNWLMIVSSSNKPHRSCTNVNQVLMIAAFPQDEGRIRLPAWSSDHNTRLIEASDDDQAYQQNSGQVNEHVSTDEHA